VRWHHQGRNRAGIDCIGLVIAVAHDLGISTYDITDYGRIPDGRRLRNEMARQLQSVGRRPALAGDVLLMRFERTPIHAGIATGGGMIHAYANMRRVVEHRIDATWWGRVVEVFAYREVD
jgi:cell wall-associated NlpC family hydrolase